MNREIKFRAWDGKKMHYDFIVARPQSYDVLSIATNEEFMINTYNGITEWKIMQYTGLKDINGKKIYEGDIIRVTSDEPDEWPSLNYVGKMLFGEHHIGMCEEEGGYGYGWFLADKDNESIMDTWWLELDCLVYEIIGNIHENQELLK